MIRKTFLQTESALQLFAHNSYVQKKLILKKCLIGTLTCLILECCKIYHIFCTQWRLSIAEHWLWPLSVCILFVNSHSNIKKHAETIQIIHYYWYKNKKNQKKKNSLQIPKTFSRSVTRHFREKPIQTSFARSSFALFVCFVFAFEVLGFIYTFILQLFQNTGRYSNLLTAYSLISIPLERDVTQKLLKSHHF